MIVGGTSMPLAPGISESAFTTVVLRTARVCGWRVHHDLPSLTAKGGHRTAVEGDIGFPDVFAAHPRHGAFAAELKHQSAPPSEVSPDQRLWLAFLNTEGGVRAYLWKPADWLPVIVPLLTEGRHPA